MAEQQLIDYIKKAKVAGQQNEQTRALLIQNGWTEAEINAAFSDAGSADAGLPKPELNTEPKTQLQPEHQVSGQPEINVQKSPIQSPKTLVNEPRDRFNPQPALKTEQPQPAHQDEPMHTGLPQNRIGPHFVLKILVVLILLSIIGTGFYFILAQGDFLQRLTDKTLLFFSPGTQIETEADNNNNANTAPPITDPQPPVGLSSKILTTVPEEYNIAKITVAAFSQSGDKSVYCAPLKIDSSKVACFQNGEKFLESPYPNKPYWIGISPNGQRIVFLYYDSVKRQAFSFENGVEGTRYDGAITSPKFSADNQDFLYIVLGNNGKSFVVLNGIVSTAHDKIFTIPDWSLDGKYLLYGARDNENISWIADEIQSLGAQPLNEEE
ncbi:MAG: hypothetical protein ABIJ84_03970 [bacterium]